MSRKREMDFEREKQLLSAAPDVFDKSAEKAEGSAETISRLHANIGEGAMEVVF